MNESLKIGMGLIVGFLLVGVLFYLLFVAEPDKHRTVLETEKLSLDYSVQNNLYLAYIKKQPLTVKEEVYLWLQNEEGLSGAEICAGSVIFVFEEGLSIKETESFNPNFTQCGL